MQRIGSSLVSILSIGLLVAGCAFPFAQPVALPTELPTSSATALPTLPPTATLEPPPQPTATTAPAIERVLIFSLDGLRADALTPEGTPNILALAAAGASTFSAQTILPSSTLPSHGSMLSGYEVAEHGLTWNDYIPSNGYIRTPTIFTLAHAAGLRTIMVVGKEKLEHIAVPGSVDRFVYVPGGDFEIAAAAVSEMAGGFGVFFVHLIGPDAAGHQYGWMSSTYLGTVSYTDEAVRRVLAALDEAGLRQTTLVILTADHGGHGTTHGSDRPEDTTIPWIVAGPGVAPGRTLNTPVRTFDTAATAAWALGLVLPPDMDGQPVIEAFSMP
jgi:arylsulfatase A-like enzyme